MAIDKELLPFIENLEKAWPEYPLSLGVDEWRLRLERLTAESAVPYPDGLTTEDRYIPGLKRTVLVRIYRPKAEGVLPALIYMHGGGWVIGSHLTHDGITADIAAQTPAVVISVHYARAPEHPYPAAVEDCLEIVKWVFAQAEELGIDPTSIFVGGDSAGGNLATVMALKMLNNSQYPIKGQLLWYPCVDTDFSRPSYIREAQAPFLKAAEMIWFWGQYAPDPQQRLEPYVTPINAKNVKGMPPALILVAEHDPLYDEGVAYAKKLQDAGVEVDLRLGKGLIHGHLRARGMSRAAQAEFDAFCDWIRTKSKE